jgi:hypothetical protein
LNSEEIAGNKLSSWLGREEISCVDKVMMETIDKHGDMDGEAWVKELPKIVLGMKVGAMEKGLEDWKMLSCDR